MATKPGGAVQRAVVIVAIGLLACLTGATTAQSAQPSPLTEVESLRVQNVNLERVIVQRAVEDWQQKVATLKADLEAKRPGFVWNAADGSWTAVPPQKTTK